VLKRYATIMAQTISIRALSKAKQLGFVGKKV